jgi:hypothetical protein
MGAGEATGRIDHLRMGMQVILHFAVANWRDLVLAVAALVVCLLLYSLWVRFGFPKDAVGNGIVIGQAKAFDNRSLSLRVERLNAGLEQLKVVSQNVTESLSNVQEVSSIETQRSLTASVAAQVRKDGDQARKAGQTQQTAEQTSQDASKSESKSNVGMAASDVLTDQLNLAAQIFNIQMLYERSLTDRMIDEPASGSLPAHSTSRLQTVLGFQVSINPPAGYEDCAAIAEIGVRMKTETVSVPVSLVALMPQEKTYNASSISTSERSINGSAVAQILTLNLGGKSKSRQFFLHRDSDTIAFERDPREQSALFDGTGTIFGWEFRPVLGRRTVSPGTRQMLAVISIPQPEREDAEQFTLEIITRSYWRHYNRRTQTTGPNWSCLPWKVDNSARMDSPVQELRIPNTANIHAGLAPKVSKIKWVNSGKGTTTVAVDGENLFSGTKVVLGGTEYSENEKNLTLKSDRAMEFETSIELLVAGDAVLSGRFGPACQLSIPEDKLPVTSLDINRATIERIKNSDVTQIEIDVVGLDKDGNYRDYTVEAINKLPEPILFVGNEPVAMPYDYWDEDPPSPGSATTGQNTTPQTTTTAAQATSPQGSAAAPTMANPATAAPATAAPTPTPAGVSAKYITVAARVPNKVLAKNLSVSFRVPFCGLNYQAFKPLTVSEPSIVRLGSDAQNTVFRITFPIASADSGSGTTPPSPTSPAGATGPSASAPAAAAGGPAAPGATPATAAPTPSAPAPSAPAAKSETAVPAGTTETTSTADGAPKPASTAAPEPAAATAPEPLAIATAAHAPAAPPPPPAALNPPTTGLLYIDLDKSYCIGPGISGDGDYLFTVPTEIVSRFQNMVVGVDAGERYVLSIPTEDKPPVKPSFDLTSKPPQINKNTRGPVEWSGSGLTAINDVTLNNHALDFNAYADGTRLLVYLKVADAATEGKFTVECRSAAGDRFSLPLFVV